MLKAVLSLLLVVTVTADILLGYYIPVFNPTGGGLPGFIMLAWTALLTITTIHSFYPLEKSNV